MENESLNRFGEAFYKAGPMDPRERIIAIEKWAERPHKGCNRTKCYFHASPNNCNSQGYCNYLPYMIDHPEDRPENGSCMRGCLPGAGCIRYVENKGKRPKPRQTRMVITLPKNQEQKERYLQGKRKNDEGVPMHRFDTEKAMQLYQDGKCDWEIAEKVGRTRDTIATWRRSLKLPSNWMPEMEKKDYTFQFDTGKAMELYGKGYTDPELAKEFEVTKYEIQKWRRFEGLEAAYNGIKMQERKYREKYGRMKDLYERGMDDDEIAAAMGTVISSVQKWRYKNNLKKNKDRSKRLKPETLQRIRELYDNEMNDKQIADELGIKSFTVSGWRQREGLPAYRITYSEKKMMELYEKKMTDAEMAREMGLSYQTVRGWRLRHGYQKNIKES